MEHKTNIVEAVNNENSNSLPQLPPLDEIIINLGFWVTMAQRASQVLVNQRFNNGVSESVEDKKSEV